MKRNNQDFMNNDYEKQYSTENGKTFSPSVNQHNENFESYNQSNKDDFEYKGFTINAIRNDRVFKWFLAACVILPMTIWLLFTESQVDTSIDAQQVLQSKVATNIATGTLLLSEDAPLEPTDHDIIHGKAVMETKIWVWDYAAEDGDYVQIIVNGVPASEPFMIKHKPRQLMVPAVGKIQVKGIRDGGGGITYAIRYDVNGTTYFNGTPEGEHNTYNLKKE